MKIKFGELSIGDILTESISLLFRHFPKFLFIYFIINIPLLVMNFIQPILMSNNAMIAYFILIGLGFLLYAFFLAPLGTASIIKLISNTYLEEPVTISSALQFGFRKFWKLFGTLFLMGLILIGGIILCLVPYIIFLIWYSFVTQIVVVEDLGGGKALSRSKNLTSGYRWRILGLGILIAVIGMIGYGALSVVNLLLTYVSYGNPFAGAGIGHSVNYLHLSIVTILNFIVQTVMIGAFNSIVMTLLYFEIRSRKEGFDLAYLSSKPVAAPSLPSPTEIKQSAKTG